MLGWKILNEGDYELNLTIPAYLILYSFLASHFIAETESRKSSELLYFASLSMASTILFYLFSGTTLL
ncbi:MAG: hypothetical protein GY852_09900 [bacterium]|nr:hypothetical protein [bacterium]